MRVERLDVFDLDGTLITVNSFRRVTAVMTLRLLVSFRVLAASQLVVAWCGRRLRVLSHLQFKRVVVAAFENRLSESERQQIVSRLVGRYANKPALAIYERSPNRVICTAAPFAIASRMSFVTHSRLISSLDSHETVVHTDNIGAAKVDNLKARFHPTLVEVATVYTDSLEDQPLIDEAVSAFMVDGSDIRQIK